MRKSATKPLTTKTPIERIFYGVFKREMTAKERRVLLANPKKPNKQN
jgi:hypothetical protein